MIKFGIIAAGEGNRIKSEGAKVSKPLLKINGVPMIGRLIKIMEESILSLKQQNETISSDELPSISVIFNREMEDVSNYLQNFVPDVNCDLKIVSTVTPSSMHSFSKLLEIMEPSDKFIVTTVDTIFRKDEFFKYVESFIKSSENIDGLMGVTTYKDDEKPLYVVASENMKITAFKDVPEKGIKFISAGVYGLNIKSIPILKSCLDNRIERMRNFQRRLIDEGFNLKAYDMGTVFDIDHLSDLEKANKFPKYFGS